MTFGKLIWLLWCVVWAIVWATIGWIVFPFNLFMFLLSMVLMIPSFAK